MIYNKLLYIPVYIRCYNTHVKKKDIAVDFLDEQYRDNPPRIVPEDPFDAADARTFVAEVFFFFN